MWKSEEAGRLPSIEYRTAGRDDLAAIGGIYLRAFPQSLKELKSPNLQPQAVADMLAVVQSVDPEAIIVAETATGEIVGYIAAPVDLGKVGRRAYRPGVLLGAVWRWMRGRYGLSFRGLFRLLLDRIELRRSDPGVHCPARIVSVAVDPAHQRQGIGRGLVQAALRRLRELGVERVQLEVRPDNLPARHLYVSLGFARVGTSRDSRGPWLVMVARTSGARGADAA